MQISPRLFLPGLQIHFPFFSLPKIFPSQGVSPLGSGVILDVADAVPKRAAVCQSHSSRESSCAGQCCGFSADLYSDTTGHLQRKGLEILL